MNENYIEIGFGGETFRLSNVSNDKTDMMLNFIKTNFMQTANSAARGDGEKDNSGDAQTPPKL